MDYRTALDWLYASQWHGVKLGLDSVQRLCRELLIQHKALQFLHVAGTNGKGSVCAMAEAVLRRNGCRTALYTSPHLLAFTERIQVNATAIPEAAVAEGLTQFRETVENWSHHPTFFELTTVLALWWFQQQQPQIVIWETGLGGRLDATNLVTPLASVITHIDFDHQEFLGNELSQIASEKAGIIKPGIPVLTASQAPEALEVLKRTAQDRASSFTQVSAEASPPSVGVPGRHQKENASLAMAACQAAGFVLNPQKTGAALAELQLPGRFQFLNETTVIDGAHNPAAARQLAETWVGHFGHQRARLLFGVMQDKAILEMLRAFLPITARLVLVPVQTATRAANPEQIYEMVRTAGDQLPPVTMAKTLEPDLQQALNDTVPTLITGSFFLVAEALTLIQQRQPPMQTSQ